MLAHNTMSLGYVRNGLNSQFHPAGPPGKTEHGAEPNALLEAAPMLLLPRVIQYHANVGGSARRRFWIQNKVEFSKKTDKAPAFCPRSGGTKRKLSWTTADSSDQQCEKLCLGWEWVAGGLWCPRTS